MYSLKLILLVVVLVSLTTAYRTAGFTGKASTRFFSPLQHPTKKTRSSSPHHFRNKALQATSPEDVLPAVQRLMQEVSFQSWYLAEEVVPAYAKIDKTGVIGFIATYIEVAIDAGKSVFTSMGVEQGYGISIILFTMLGTFCFLLSSLLFV